MLESGYTQRETARAIGVTQGTVSYWVIPGNREKSLSRDKNRVRSPGVEGNNNPHSENYCQRWAPKHVAKRRVIAGEPDPVTMTAAQLFAAGKIDRAELSYALRNGELP
jgi:transposase-like protein